MLAFQYDPVFGGEEKHTMGQYNESRSLPWSYELFGLNPTKQIRKKLHVLFEQSFGSYAASKLHRLGVNTNSTVFIARGVIENKPRFTYYDVFEPITRYYVRVFFFGTSINSLDVVYKKLSKQQVEQLVLSTDDTDETEKDPFDLCPSEKRYTPVSKAS